MASGVARSQNQCFLLPEYLRELMSVWHLERDLLSVLSPGPGGFSRNSRRRPSTAEASPSSGKVASTVDINESEGAKERRERIGATGQQQSGL